MFYLLVVSTHHSADYNNVDASLLKVLQLVCYRLASGTAVHIKTMGKDQPPRPMFYVTRGRHLGYISYRFAYIVEVMTHVHRRLTVRKARYEAIVGIPEWNC